MTANLRPLLRGAWLLRFAALSLVACNTLAGIGAPELGSSDGGTTGTRDAAAPGFDADMSSSTNDGGSPAADALPEDGGGGLDATLLDADVPDTNVPDTNVPDTFTPPPPAAKPGFDITAGGTYGKSASFSLIAVVGESPGGDNVGKSQSFVLKAGVIVVTQPN